MRIYFSGPHGAGKSSLIRGICDSSPDFIAYPDKLKFAKVENPYFLRQKSKITKIFQEYCDQLDYENQHPGKIVLGDRCIYDCLVYSSAYQKLGWISKEQNEQLKKTADLFDECWPDNLVILNPPYDVLVQHIRQRWKTKQKKWNESNFDYLNAVRDEFAETNFSCRNLLYLDEVLSVEQEVEKVLNWMHEKILTLEEMVV
jgi:thymidylate kinase